MPLEGRSARGSEPDDRYAQTSHQLFHQLVADGYGQEEIELCADAYDLAAELCTAMYRPSGKTFLAHLVGTGSILARLGASAELVAAGLLHSAYTHGDFGTSFSADPETARRKVAQRASAKVARYLDLYAEFSWAEEARIELRDRLADLGDDDREMLLLRLANELEDWLDAEIAWSGNAKGRGKEMVRVVGVLVDLANGLGFPGLAAEFEHALLAHQAAKVPEHLLRRRQPVSVIASPSWSEAERTVSHPRSADLLTDDEVAFFKENGYVVRTGVLEPEGMRRAVDCFWSRAPESFDRSDSSTWHGEVEAYGGRFDLADSHGRMKLRGETRTEPFLLELLPRNPTVWRIAEQLLGEGQVRRPTTIRGLYATFPDPHRDSPELPGHVDKHPFSLGVIGYLEDVEPRGGGTRIWPGSHLVLHDEFHSLAEYDPRESFVAALEGLNREPGLEFTGRAGDVLFWHPRLLHCPGRNRLPSVRQAILCDFRRDDIETIQGLPRPDDIWEHWAI